MATKITKGIFTCWVCQTNYSGLVVHSWYSKHGKPEIKPLRCPRCCAPPKWSQRPQIGHVRDLMATYLEQNGDQKVIKRLVKDCIIAKDVDAWQKLILDVDYDSLIVDIRRSGEKIDNYVKKNFGAVELLGAIDTAKALKSRSESAERLKSIVISKEPKGYWERVRALIKADPTLLNDAIEVRRQQRDETVAQLEEFKQVRRTEKFKKELEIIVAEVKSQILEEKQKYLLNHKGQHDKAILDCNTDTKIITKLDEAYNDRGNDYRIMGRYDKAISDYTKAIEINSENAKAYYNRGNVFYFKGQYDKAITDYTKAIEINPKDTKEYYYKIGCAYSLQKDLSKALKYLELAFQNGYDDFDWLSKDADWDNISSSDEFKMLIDKYKK